MFVFHTCFQINENTYHEDIPLEKLQELIKKFTLTKIGKVKEYWINNVLIQYRDGIISYQYVKDITISYDKNNNILIQELESTPCNPFNFYKVDLEDEYIQYENKIDNVSIFLKKYKNHLTLEFSCDNKENFNDFFYIYNI
jgi:hypothetical protein